MRSPQNAHVAAGTSSCRVYRDLEAFFAWFDDPRRAPGANGGLLDNSCRDIRLDLLQETRSAMEHPDLVYRARFMQQSSLQRHLPA